MTLELTKPAADVFDAARTRRSVRAYKPDVIPPETLREIVALGRWAPSGSNIQAYRAGNYVFFGAPAGLVRTIDRTLEVGSWFDYGLFAQTLMLAARARGLHTCAEASIASYPDIVRRELGISRDYTIMCGIAMGYAQDDAVVNTFQPTRIELDEYATFYD